MFEKHWSINVSKQANIDNLSMQSVKYQLISLITKFSLNNRIQLLIVNCFKPISNDILTVSKKKSNRFCFPQTLWLSATVNVSENGMKITKVHGAYT